MEMGRNWKGTRCGWANWEGAKQEKREMRINWEPNGRGQIGKGQIGTKSTLDIRLHSMDEKLEPSALSVLSNRDLHFLHKIFKSRSVA